MRNIAAGISKIAFAATVASSLALAGCERIEQAGEEARGSGEGVVELSEYPERPLWGDTHLHTDNSIDAFGFGTRLGPEAALQFASGVEVTATSGMTAKLDRPLDFLVIADHSDGLGATRRIYDAPRLLIRDPVLRKWHDMMHKSPQQSTLAVADIITRAAAGNLPDAMRDPERNRTATTEIWQTHLDTLDRYNRPGTFTAMAGFEYTLMPGGNNLHRVVVFRDGSDLTKQVLPFPGVGGGPVDTLFDYMDRYERTTGGRVLSIPHNSNLSNGMMFETTMPDGAPMTAEYARRRAAREPLVEVTQIKGDSETHAFLSPNDEFASYGDAGWELGNLDMSKSATPDMYAGSYVREALKRGLSIEERTGANPYAFGMIGSTDSHTSLATADEGNYFGKHTGVEPSATRALSAQNLGTRGGRMGWHYLASGYAAVWARANTRAAIFDAMQAREVYATTGPRMTVRLFGGFDFTADDLDGDWVRAGYGRGVPMGGELDDTGRAPRFMVSALKDPEGANLDRVQIVKGWVDADGDTQERVYDVVWSDMEDRLRAGGVVPAVGDSVDRGAGTYENSIGAAELATVWTDPDYRAGQRAFYYVRVLEIPTPQWFLYDAIRFGFKLPADVMDAAVAQERAYSSPIWVRPKPPAPAADRG